MIQTLSANDNSSFKFNHHDPDCLDFAERGLDEIQTAIFGDIFCKCHRYAEPKILPNGTTIAWPAGWSQEEASAWRTKHDLCSPS